MMYSLFAPREPFATGMLDVGDGNKIYWECSGNPNGIAAVALHGGPGGGSSPGRRKSFDPAIYQLVQFDQRGCGQSTPSAGDWTTSLEFNTTNYLIEDIEKLRVHLGINKWLVWGASWGSSLAIAYTLRHSQHVSAVILLSTMLTRSKDIHWLYHDVGRYFPQQWGHFQQGATYAENLVEQYNKLLNLQPDLDLRKLAVDHWCKWEDAVVSLESGAVKSLASADEKYRVAFARLCAHYFANVGWLDAESLLEEVKGLGQVPAVLIHGQFDLGCPSDVAWELAKRWPGAECYFVNTGHTGGEEMTQKMLWALDRFRSLKMT